MIYQRQDTESEHEEVLKRAEHRLVHGLTEESVAAFISELAAPAEPVEMHFSWRPQSADPGDEMVIASNLFARLSFTNWP